MATNLFYDNKFFELLDLDDAMGSSTFVLQYFTDSREKYNKFIDRHVDLLEQKSLEKWKDKFVAFSTVMKVVH